MKKRVLSLVMSTAMVASALTACGGSTTETTQTTTETKTEATAETTAEAKTEETVDYGSGEISIWVADNVTAFTEAKAKEFLASDPAFSGYTVSVQAVGEGDAASNMITDVAGGADIYGFAQDQMARLVSAGALQPVVGDYAAWVAEQNDAGAVSAAQVGDLTYAFPLTSDNGYFLYYDKSVVTDPSSLEAIVADCEAAGKNFYFEINSGWYQTAFFFGTGCELTYDTDSDGNYTACNASYASDAGVVALKEIIELSTSSAFQNGSSLSTATNVGAIVDGTWDSSAAKDLFGDNYACAKLPSFTGADGNSYQLSGFGGFKLLGIKPQEDAGKLQVCYKLAQFLSNADTQLARYTEAGWGPSNLEAQKSEAVQADVALTALAEQLAYTIPQGNYPGDYWALATSLGDDVITKNLTPETSDEDLMKALQTFQDTCVSYAN